MRKNFSTILIVGAALLLASCVQQKESFSPVDYVNPLMGTESTYAFSHGNTYPAVAVPWGMNFWSPQTGENGSGWMYTYTVSDTGVRRPISPVRGLTITVLSLLCRCPVC